MCACARVTGCTFTAEQKDCIGRWKASPWNPGGSRAQAQEGLSFLGRSRNCRAEGPLSLNSLSIEGVNLPFQGLDKAAQSCLLLNLIC